MSAARHLHPGQLGMLYPASHLADPGKIEHYEMKYGYGDNDPAHFAELKTEKLAEAKTGTPEDSRNYRRGGRTLMDSIREEGIKRPVEMYHPAPGSTKPELGEGHHRVFTANHLNPKTEVPVRWVDDHEDPDAFHQKYHGKFK